MAAFGIHELRKQTAEEFPDATSATPSAGPGTGSSARSKAPTWASAPRNCACPKCAAPSQRGAEAPTEPLATSGEDARLQRLERLGTLHEKGVLTDEEFAAEKSRVLGP